jgi:lipopolysaccharide transport system ATP-binding protein
VKASALGITLRSKRAGVEVFSTDTEAEKTPLGRMQGGQQIIVDFTLEVPLQGGTYTIDAAISVPREEVTHLDEAKEASSFKLTKVGSELSFKGMVHLPTRVDIRDPEGERERPSRSA